MPKLFQCHIFGGGNEGRVSTVQQEEEEIRGVPPNMEYISAELHENGNTRFAFSGRIPRWFEKCSRGASISFWFRGEFPSNALCIAILLTDKQPSPVRVTPIFTINGNQVSCGSENKWNHAELSYEARDEVKYQYEEVPAESIAKDWEN
ncbi:hypothetical protein PIB30_031541 [Stylosanthes scabra]|uniref:Uncharacterized protein n=1 Tax=Stylosanthes scabra TaxID=79078 RepID=A0ABU6QBE5_9FABA|nr:hypothetical protein [Stylosanthes scabra]